MATVLINGFGRIGRALFRLLLDRPGIEVSRINDPLPASQLAYLLKYDSVMGQLAQRVSADNGVLVVGDRRFSVSHAPAPGKPEISGSDIVVNSSGRNNTRAVLDQMIEAGARRVVVSMPLPRGDCDVTILRGVNDADLKPDDRIISAGVPLGKKPISLCPLREIRPKYSNSEV
jgi:glyceraldehyde-3-phosphate dehydrogenase/erythrose-4-phosphate dehydrogenase